MRQGSQIAFLAFFVYLLFEAYQGRVAHLWADILFRFDPLAALTAMLSARAWIPRLALALVTVALTVVAGRVWCGWICPMGTLLEWFRFRRASERATTLSPRWRTSKYLILVAIVAAALFGNLTLMILDPIAILTRTATTAVLPALNAAITGAERLAYAARLLRPAVDVVERALRGPVLPTVQYYFAANVTVALMFAVIVGLNLVADRFWCRYLCPLGGLLAILSKAAPFRRVVSEQCSRCAQCAGSCPMDTIEPARGYASDPGECTLCLDCLKACPRNSIAFRWQWEPTWRDYDPSRRQVLAALAAGAAGVALANTAGQVKEPDPYLIRPPGALGADLSDDVFLSKCIRCGACIKVCPTGGLQLSGMQQLGLKGLWTPHLVPRLGHCDYGCHACGQVCPSGAIPPLPLSEKQSTVIGRAYIDMNRCLPWADNIRCAVCEEMCPVPDKAIVLQGGDEGESDTSSGGGLGPAQGAPRVPRPYVLSSLCIGCGLCEKRCPLNGESAIRVYLPNEPTPFYG